MPTWLLALLVAHIILAVGVVIAILRSRKEPTAMTAWILAVLTIPVLGMWVYWIFGSGRVRRKARRRRRRVHQLVARLHEWAQQQSLGRAEPPELDLAPDLRAVAMLGRRLVDMPATPGNEVTVFEEANETYGALETAIRSARHHVHLLYYIWQPDETGRHFRDLLIERAREGVECRVLLDAIGCLRLGRRFLDPLRAAGVKVAFFLPLAPFPPRYSLHLRNHRKIAVVDSHTAFTGSQNIGDEYRGRLKRLSPWYDTHLRIRGPAALFLQQVFAEDWGFATHEQLDAESYFLPPQRPGASIVQVLPTGPDQPVSPLEQVIFAAVASAGASIRVATPYFVPDRALRMALIHACARGVRVQLVLPSKSDSPLALWAARSFYAELLDAGVEICEYDAGVLHSKLVTVDDRWCMVGSANMDARSFRLNFEITVLLYDRAVTDRLNASIDRQVAAARQISRGDAWRRPFLVQVGEGAARLFAPQL